MKNTLLIVLFLLLVSCSPSPEQISTPLIATLTAWPTQTPYPTYTLLPTHTPYPTYTPPFTPTVRIVTKIVTETFTATPAYTATASLTPTQTPTFAPLTSYKTINNWEDFMNNPGNYQGKLVKIFVESADYVKPFVYAWSPDYQYVGYVLLATDDRSPVTMWREITGFSYLWVYGIVDSTVPRDNYEVAKIIVMQIEKPTPDKAPKEDGLYSVSTEIAPGRWRSSYPMTHDGCYWARINKNGDIIDNHFGVAGVTVTVRNTDAVIEFSGCGTWIYLGP